MRGDVGVLVAVGGVVTVGTLPVFLVGGLAVQIRAELGLSVSLLGLAGSLFFASSALVARGLAVVTERIGPTSALRLAATGSAVCLVMLAATPSTAWLLAGLALAGIPTALSQPAANELLMARVAQQRRGFAFAVKQSAIPASTLLAGIAVPAVALTVGWRWAFVLAAVFALLTVPTVPRVRWRRATRSADAGAHRSGLLVLAAVTGLGAAAANALGTFVTISAVSVGYSEAAAGLMLSLGSAAGLAVRLAAGAIADRAKPDLLRMVAAMLGLGGVGYLLLAINQPVTFLIGLLLGFGAGWAWPGVFNYAVAARFPDRVTAVTSVTQTGVYLGAAGGPLLFGLVAEHAGTAAAWLISSVLATFAAMILTVTRRRC